MSPAVCAIAVDAHTTAAAPIRPIRAGFMTVLLKEIELRPSYASGFHSGVPKWIRITLRKELSKRSFFEINDNNSFALSTWSIP
jgi:hypothetical protein